MENTAVKCNRRQLFRFLEEAGIKNTTVNETISEKDGTITHFQSMKLNRRAEHFREQFNCPSTTPQLPTISSQSEWWIDVSPSTLSKVVKTISNVKEGRGKGGSDELNPGIFRNGGPVLAVKLTAISAKIWEPRMILSE